MWESLVVDKSQIDGTHLESILSGNNSAMVIKNFYDKDICQKVTNRIKYNYSNNIQGAKLNLVGPFLMSYITKKEKYFEDSKLFQKKIELIFSGMKFPTSIIHQCISQMLPSYSISLATENNNRYSPFVIRIHEKEDSIPVHKDNVLYEGIEYKISDIDDQLSCVLHLQEPESGEDLVMYDKQWKKEDERFRNIDFGYSSNLVASSNRSKMSNISMGDLVIINPKYYHRVTKISGSTPRITLGMFLGFYRKDCKIVTWA